MYLKKCFVGASAVMIMLMNSPQVSADEVEIFGGEFENSSTQPEQTQNETPPPENNSVTEETPPVTEEVTPAADEPVQTPPVTEEVAPVVDEPVQTPPVTEEVAPVVDEPVQTQPVTEEVTPAVDEPVQTQPVTEEVAPVVDEPVQTQPVTEEVTPAVDEPVQTQPVTEEVTPAVDEPVQTQPVTEEVAPAVDEPFTNGDDENFGDELIFAEPNNQPVEVFTPDNPREKNNNRGNVTIVKPRENNSSTSAPAPTKAKSLKKLPQRFIQIAVDENYIYYLDKQSVSWKKIPYMNSEYMADVWVRMIERNSDTDDLPADMAAYINDTNTDEIALAKAKGYQYMPDDINVLSHKKYFLEHYYLRPQKDQVQFLCELEVVGHPQNTASQRKYNPANWEDLIPGSMESILYYSIIQVIGKSKASDKGHMTFADMVEEYGRISIR